MEELSLDNILTGTEIEDLFTDEETQESALDNAENKEGTSPKEKEETTEVNANTLFEEPESVGSEEDKEVKEGTDQSKGTTSPNFYSSIAKAFAEEGIFPDLNEETVSKIKTPEDFKLIIEEQIQSNLDARLKRIDEALNVGVQPSIIKQYEDTLNYLDNLDEALLSNEDNLGEELRKKLIYQDFINRGYSKERAVREVEKSFKGGTDIEDAKEALNGNKDFFNIKYKELIDAAKQEEELFATERKKQMEKLRSSILEDSKIFGELEVDKATRQRALDNLIKPVHKDPNTGEMLTALQKYEKEHREDFLKNLSFVYTLTNGFKNLDGLVKDKIRKEVKKGFKELESTLNNTARTSDGNLKFISGVDSESFIGKGWTIDA